MNRCARKGVENIFFLFIKNNVKPLRYAIWNQSIKPIQMKLIVHRKLIYSLVVGLALSHTRDRKIQIKNNCTFFPSHPDFCKTLRKLKLYVVLYV